MYTTKNYKTKKEVKAAVARLAELTAKQDRSEVECLERTRLQNALFVWQPNGDITGVEAPVTGRVYLEGPHYPEPHRWYAQGEVEGGVLIKIK